MLEFLARVLPITPLINPQNQFFVVYLAATAVFGLIILGFRRREPGVGLVRQLLPRAIWAHPSSHHDWQIVVINRALLAVVSLGGWVSAIGVAGIAEKILTVTIGHPSGHLAWGAVASIAFTVATIVAYDFGDWLQHRLQHRVPVLWEFHKIHHSAEVMTPITAIRIHPVGVVVKSTFVATTSGLVIGVFHYFYGQEIPIVALLGTNVLIVLHCTVGLVHLQHSHIWLLFPGSLKRHLISPATHMIHHSRDPRHFGVNYGFIFAWWDRLAGTFYTPTEEDRQGLVLGLPAEEQDDYQTLAQLYWVPFRNVFRMARRRPARSLTATE